MSPGLICVLGAVEPCTSFDIFRNKATKHLEVVRRRRTCLHDYWYYLHPGLGLCHVRVQGWFPFQVQVWVNAREALSTSLTAQGVRHTRYQRHLLGVELGSRPAPLIAGPAGAGRASSTGWPAR